MTSPLSPVREASLNRATPPSKRKYDQYQVHACNASVTTTETARPSPSPRSSPFVPNVDETTDLGQENKPKPTSKYRHSRVLSGTELSPLRLLETQRNSSDGTSDVGPRPQRSPRRLYSPESRFPVKIGSPRDGDAEATRDGRLSMEDVVRENGALERAMEIFEDERSGLEEAEEFSAIENQEQQKKPRQWQQQHQPHQEKIHHQREAQSEAQRKAQHEHSYDETAAPDDSIISTFSTFSVVPNLTVFANLGQSPSKPSAMELVATPRANKLRQQEYLARPPSSSGSHGNTSNLLMDFADQMRFPNKSPAKRGSASPSRPVPNMAAATPNNGQVASLLDFDIPPMPTPRSLPSVTPRELESLKSGFLSEISSLKASLSGKEAEVHSLKTAVGDAETRVGESLEQLHEERALKAQLVAEKEDWEKRGRDMEDVLRKVREEMVASQHDRDELEQKLEESEKRREAAEMLHQEAESKMAGMRAGKDVVVSPDKTKATATAPAPAPAPATTDNKEVEMAVERVARELHALYKGKHETKVAALKKSYESRWEKRVKELESRILELRAENEQLRDREMNMSRLAVDPDTTAAAEERIAQAAKDGAAIRELTADVQRLEAIVSTVKRDNKELRTMLEKERVEKGELVLLAEEMMSMQAMAAAGSASASAAQPELQQTPAATKHHDRRERASSSEGVGAKTPRPSGGDVTRNSHIARSAVSGLRAPGSVARPSGLMRRASGGLPRPGRSGIMNSIEKMGNYRGRGQE
ncbi:hypothetical protein E4U43_002295 [Claviceps pusilla]|uniref:Kinetoplast-associated protein KAP n=1 Tax=Claviceps pusilla TaxID=123648 RepID=A0A9P7N8Y3_9HYPO|nr:hypothetical protein E4U43_002295 [Claviceps pusilla]